MKPIISNENLQESMSNNEKKAFDEETNSDTQTDIINNPDFNILLEDLIDDEDIIDIIDIFDEEEEYHVLISFCPQHFYKKMNEILDHVIDVCFVNNSLLKVSKHGMIFIGFNEDVINENPRIWLRFLSNLCTVFKADSICITTKTDKKLDVITYSDKELDFQGRKIIRESFEEYLEQLQANTLDPINIDTDILIFKEIYRHEGLVLRNVNSDVKLDEECLSYISKLSDIWLSDSSCITFPLPYDPIFCVMDYPKMTPHFPIILKKEVPSYENLWRGINDRKYIPKGKVLGYYTRDESFCNGPHIVLSPENIMEVSENFCIPFKVLMTTVLVHELAHAIMDKYRIIDENGITYTDIEENWPNSVEAKGMEESLANAVTLNCFKKYASSHDLEYVQHFINNCQPSIYRFGLWQSSIGAKIENWRNTNKQNSPALNEWFNLCFRDGLIRIPINEYSMKDYIEAVK